MSIIYALIAREDDLVSENGNNIHVLTEYSGDVTGNFPQVTRERVLKQVPKNRKSFYKYKDRYVFHSVNEDGFTYLCLADSDYPKTRAHVFLEELKISFCNKYPPQMRQAAISYSLIGFSETIKQKMEYYNNNKMDPKITKIRDQAGSTLNLMEQNMEAIIDRGETIELLVKKAGTLNVESGLLKERSATYKEQARKEALKRAAIIGGVVLVIVYMLFIRGKK